MSVSEQDICLDCRFCCKFLIMMNQIEDEEKRERTIDFNLKWGCHVLRHTDNKTFEIAIPLKCQWLTPLGCSIYTDEIRPEVCERFRGRTNSAFFQRNCKLFPIRMKEQQDAEAGNTQTG